MKPGDIVLIRFPQADLKSGKLRPALIIAISPSRHRDLLLALISSRLHQATLGFDEIINTSLQVLGSEIFNLFGSNSPPLAAYNRKMSEYIHKSHNVSVLLYHLVFPAKYRKAVFDEQVDSLLKEVCLEMEKRYEIKFVEIGVDKDHVHFLVQSVPTYSVTRIVTMIKSITAREIFKKCPQVKKQLWGGEFWSDGYYASTVGKHGDEGMIARYVKEQDKEYLQLHQNLQLSLF